MSHCLVLPVEEEGTYAITQLAPGVLVVQRDASGPARPMADVSRRAPDHAAEAVTIAQPAEV
jgi:hypothetical protein